VTQSSARTTWLSIAALGSLRVPFQSITAERQWVNYFNPLTNPRANAFLSSEPSRNCIRARVAAGPSLGFRHGVRRVPPNAKCNRTLSTGRIMAVGRGAEFGRTAHVRLLRTERDIARLWQIHDASRNACHRADLSSNPNISRSPIPHRLSEYVNIPSSFRNTGISQGLNFLAKFIASRYQSYYEFCRSIITIATRSEARSYPSWQGRIMHPIILM